MDDSLLALLGENGDQVFHLSDEIYADELQMQEVIQASLIVSTAIPDGDVRSEISTSNTGDSSRSVCEICAERKEKNEMFRSETCNRSFCSQCIRSHGKMEINEYSVLRSDLNCGAPIGPEHVRRFVPEKEIARWEVALCEATVLPAEKFHCPFKDCSALLVNDAAAGEVIKESECPECRRLFCARCVVPWHAGLECEELPVQEAIQPSLIDSMEIPDGDVPSEISKSNTQSGDSSRSFCEICTERKEKNEMFRSETCNHSFCSQCIRSHVVVKLEMNVYSVLCPDLNCGAPIGPEHVRRIVPEKEIDRWEVALCEATVLPEEKFYCPFKDCSALLVNDAAAGEVIKESECPICRRLFCAQCVMPWHAGLECEEVGKLGKDEREREDLMVRALAKDRKWMSCPNCKAIVERTHGCIKMTCRCKFEFCHVCGSKWDETHWGTCQRT